MSKDDCRFAKFGKIPGNSPRILWREDRSMFTPKGIPYLPEENECELPLESQKQELFGKDIVPKHRRWQRGRRPETIREDSKIILSELYGGCVVIDGYMHPINDIVRGSLCKPPVQVQERAEFTSLCEIYDEDVYHNTIKSLEDDELMQYHRTMLCLKIARVVPDESNDRRQEMLVIQANDLREIGVYCSRNEWKHTTIV
jgi:hypothetical protein